MKSCFRPCGTWDIVPIHTVKNVGKILSPTYMDDPPLYSDVSDRRDGFTTREGLTVSIDNYDWKGFWVFVLLLTSRDKKGNTPLFPSSEMVWGNGQEEGRTSGRNKRIGSRSGVVVKSLYGRMAPWWESPGFSVSLNPKSRVEVNRRSQTRLSSCVSRLIFRAEETPSPDDHVPRV